MNDQNAFLTFVQKSFAHDIAGASRVVAPYQLEGRRMAQVLKTPTVIDFIDTP